ncbi:MAG: hypothetical protein HY908_15620 [Myxococcales bacterium]|nr:hypothetical protein [Myxococcales bacterium]
MWRPAGRILAAALLALGAAPFAFDALAAESGVCWPELLAASGLVFGAGLLLRGARTALELALRYRRSGRLCWAIGDGVCLLVDARGRSVEFSLADVARLGFEEGEVALVLDCEARGAVYAALFDLFDGALPGPSARRFHLGLARALARVRPLALEPSGAEEPPESVAPPAATPLSWRPPRRATG